MKKLTLLLIAVGMLSTGCLLTPKNCTVTLTSNDKSYSFDWDYDEVMEDVVAMELNHPDILVTEGEEWCIKKCVVRAWYEDGGITITLNMLCGPEYIWTKNNPMRIKCSERRFEKFQKKTGIGTDYYETGVTMTVVRWE